ncbi:MAG: methyltransferase domain-containing protein [Chloroflexi bacterium]|nr:methyltransferase domain-containing protein [Chloroflexota bacterium]
MDHADHVQLLWAGIPSAGGVWADFGAGGGAFTLALAELIGPGGEIIAIDRDAERLRVNEDALRARFPEVPARHVVADFTAPLDKALFDLPALDGIVIANALHFAREQPPVVELLRGYLAAGGRLLIVEYNAERGNSAVPYPVAYERWQRLASDAGFAHTELLARRPSRFLGEIYSAASW